MLFCPQDATSTIILVPQGRNRATWRAAIDGLHTARGSQRQQVPVYVVVVQVRGNLQIDAQNLNIAMSERLFPVLGVRAREEMQQNLLLTPSSGAFAGSKGGDSHPGSEDQTSVRDDPHQNGQGRRTRSSTCKSGPSPWIVESTASSPRTGPSSLTSIAGPSKEPDLLPLQTIDHGPPAMMNHHRELTPIFIRQCALGVLPLKLVPQLSNATQRDDPRLTPFLEPREALWTT